ncbi:MAG TPA: hypothetical protein VFN67_05935, partial [Polyangiales bacterium]|nr:hypothetical protein [Polyangiales bacterium]
MTHFGVLRTQALLWIGALLAALTAFVLWSSHYLPGVDFPQHTAQLAAWAHLSDPAFGFADQFELNYRTPYLLCYLLARPWVSLVGAVHALKLVLFCLALANAGALWLLLRACQQDEWVALFGFPLCFGFSFYHGFIDQLLATPLLTAALALSLSYAKSPTSERAASLCALLVALGMCHALAFIVCAPVSLLVYIRESAEHTRRHPLQYWPFAAALLSAALWLLGLANTTDAAAARPVTNWALDPERVLEAPGMLLSANPADLWASVFGALSMLVVVCSLGLPTWSWHRLSLYAGTWLLFLLGPLNLWGAANVYQRFTPWILPGGILSSGTTAPLWGERTRRSAILLLSVGWLGILCVRAREFDAESRDFDRASADLECARVRPLISATDTQAFPQLPAYRHFPAYLQAERGGHYGFAFARYQDS